MIRRCYKKENELLRKNMAKDGSRQNVNFRTILNTNKDENGEKHNKGRFQP